MSATMPEANPWTDLVTEFGGYIADIYSQPEDVRAEKLAAVLSRLADSAVRQASSTMLAIDVNCSTWTNSALAEKMLQHVAFRSSKDNMLPAHCMMLEASKRLACTRASKGRGP